MVLAFGSELINLDVITFYGLIRNGFDVKTSNGVEINAMQRLRERTWELVVVLSANDELSQVPEKCVPVPPSIKDLRAQGGFGNASPCN